MLVIGAFSLGIVYGLDAIQKSNEPLPRQFQSAYKEASQSGQKVIGLMNSINKKVEEINSLDLEGESEKSLRLIEEAKAENQTAKEEAKKLSKSLKEIQNMLEGVSGSEKAQVILEAIKIESELANKFLSYTNDLDKFLNSLSSAIESDSFSDRISVEQKLDSVNQKKKVINSLNSKFLSKLEELNQFN